MPRAKKDSKNFNINLAIQTYEDLERFCEETGLTKTAATEKILNKFFSEYFERGEEERSLFR